MEQFVETGALILPSADLLIKQVQQIQDTLPGWWWSLSFTETNVQLTVGPDRLVPDPKHLAWMNTREGDLGLVYTTYTHSDERKIILPLVVETMLQRMMERLRTIGVSDHQNWSIGQVPVNHTGAKYRYQNSDDLENLRKEYQRFLNELPFIWNSEFIIREFYIGSCGLTVDCSIRGGDDEHEFDCSGDNYDGNIGDAVRMSLDDLLQDIRATDPALHPFLKEQLHEKDLR